MKLLYLFCFILAFLAPSGSLQAQSALKVVPEVMFESNSPKAGSNVRIAIVLRASEGWHTYWSYPGDAGAPLRAQWFAPEGFAFSPILHPAPRRLDVSGIVSFVHNGEHILLQSMKVPSGLPFGTLIPLSVNLDWLSCSSNQCVPERQTLKFTLVVGQGENDFSGLSNIRLAESRLPRTLSGVSLALEGDNWLFRIPGEHQQVQIFPDSDKWFRLDAIQSLSYRDSVTEIRIPVADPTSSPSSFSGLIRLGNQAFTVERIAPHMVRKRPLDEPSASPSPVEAVESDISPPPTPEATAPISEKVDLNSSDGVMKIQINEDVKGFSLVLIALFSLASLAFWRFFVKK